MSELPTSTRFTMPELMSPQASTRVSALAAMALFDEAEGSSSPNYSAYAFKLGVLIANHFAMPAIVVPSTSKTFSTHWRQAAHQELPPGLANTWCAWRFPAGRTRERMDGWIEGNFLLWHRDALTERASLEVSALGAFDACLRVAAAENFMFQKMDELLLCALGMSSQQANAEAGLLDIAVQAGFVIQDLAD